MAVVQYFNSRTGRELSKWEATDSRGILLDGCTMRVKTMMRDSANNPKRRIVDARRPNDPLALSRPGFRISSGNSLDDTLAQVGLADVYKQHETYLNNAYKLGATAPVVHEPTTDARIIDEEKECPDCNGNGFDEDGATCPTCQGEGTIEDDDDFGDAAARRVDHRMTIDEMRLRHQQNMARLYQDHETFLQNAWRGRGGK